MWFFCEILKIPSIFLSFEIFGEFGNIFFTFSHFLGGISQNFIAHFSLSNFQLFFFFFTMFWGSYPNIS